MFSSDQLWVMIFGVLLALGFIIFCMYSVNKLFVDKTQDVLVRFILLIFAALVGVFVVDKIVAFKIQLLEEGQNDKLFELIKTLVLMIFSYYFGTQKVISASNDQENKNSSNDCDCK